MSSSDNNSKIYVNKRGEPVLRISEVVKTLAKDQLILWANMLGFKRISYKHELERTANIGTFAHAMIELYYSDHSICYYDYEKYGIYGFMDRQQAYNAANSFFKWLEKHERNYKVLETEKVMIGDKVGGTTDAIIQSPFNKDKIMICDYKTSSAIHFTHFLQAAGYVSLYEELYGKNKVDGVMIIRLDKKNGDIAESKMIRMDNLESYIVCFESLLTVATMTSVLQKSYKDDLENF